MSPLLLQMSLDAAVPLHQIEIVDRFGTADVALAQLTENAASLRELLASEDLLYRSKKPGGSAKAFNALAEAVALMSIIPGGVTVFGHRWVFPERLWN